jgi:hypothetical protein
MKVLMTTDNYEERPTTMAPTNNNDNGQRHGPWTTQLHHTACEPLLAGADGGAMTVLMERDDNEDDDMQTGQQMANGRHQRRQRRR